MMDITADMLNLYKDEFWDVDHVLTIVFNDGSIEEYCVPQLWCAINRDELIKFVVEYNELEDVNYDDPQTGCCNG